MLSPLYSVIIPVFNSENTLGELCARIIALFEKRRSPVEIIMVNDGSKDHSWECIKALTGKYPGHVTGIDLLHNSGQHKALLCGIRNCKGCKLLWI